MSASLSVSLSPFLGVCGSYPQSSAHSRVFEQSPHSASGIRAWPLSEKRGEDGACGLILELSGMDCVAPREITKLGLWGREGFKVQGPANGAVQQAELLGTPRSWR